jgi:glycosyltransferase involved in cell wall biosynthesis
MDLRVAFLGFYYGPGGGIARATVNLARGLRLANADVGIFALSMHPQWRSLAEEGGVDVVAPREGTIGKLDYLRLMYDFDYKLARGLDSLLRNSGATFDVYVVSDDAALSFARFKGDRRLILWTHGEISLLLINSAWARTPARRLASVLFPRVLAEHRRLSRGFDLIIANSRLAKEIAQFTYERVPSGIVYLPVDTEMFRPVKDPSGDYALAVGRPFGEAGEALLARLARKVPLVTVGGLRVPGARSLGYIQSSEELARIYANAKLVLHTGLGEYFGYSVAESLACGTPAVAYDVGGPSEMIESGRNGWLVTTEGEYEGVVARVFEEGYGPEVRESARASALRFSIDNVTREFLRILKTNLVLW